MKGPHFFKPWIEIDPELKNGGIPDELAPFFVGPDLNDNAKTKSDTLLSIFNNCRNLVQSISMHPSANREGSPDKRVVTEILKGINSYFETIVDETHSDATNFFDHTHADPPYQHFGLAPIRYPLRMDMVSRFVHRGIGTLVEIAELNRNAAHSGLRPQDAETIIAPMYDYKAWVIKHFFDLEVAGEISAGELSQLFVGRFRPGPVVSLSDESAERPDTAEVSVAMSGIDVMQWYPTQDDWAVFAKLSHDRYTPERIFQPEGAMSTTEDVAFEQKVAPGGEPIVGRGQP